MELNSEEARQTPRVRLGRRLRRLRERRCLSLRQLSERVGGYSHSYLGRVELGEQLPSEALVHTLDEFFDTDGVLAELLELAHDTLIPDYSRKTVNKEAEAERIQVFNSSVIPGLLQTPEYARASFRRSLLGESEEQINERVAVRVKRQRVLDREQPPYYWGIMDEAALKRPIGGTQCMVTQIQHLLQFSTRPHVTVQVLPFHKGAHPLLGGALTLHTMSDGATIAAVESFDSGAPTETPRKVLELTQRFDLARSLALTDDESFDLIHKYLKEYEGEDDS
ncbi:helix-turn-helix domain-containing protein [Streptomyces sp. OF8]|uniref:Helix-turn-helix domain-containing protein n=1 Tax=Streptomyces alkaliterrae TaxID=2213162 RepID=A0A5P0YWP4_9ACTN|nr:helix-turn-helix domain-containing protein [Streptomyces alkaliterrae]MQS03912.1 helix-turn-helix domain-containing protein [Streptomyces alkaliterrae]